MIKKGRTHKIYIGNWAARNAGGCVFTGYLNSAWRWIRFRVILRCPCCGERGEGKGLVEERKGHGGSRKVA